MSTACNTEPKWLWDGNDSGGDVDVYDLITINIIIIIVTPTIIIIANHPRFGRFEV